MAAARSIDFFPTPMQPSPAPTPDIRTRYALIIALVGLLIPAVLVLLLQGNTTAWSAAELTSLAALFTGIVGTLVGAFLGVQVAVAGTQQAQQQAAAATERAVAADARASRAIQELPADKRASFL